jgi:hypothetical protein
VVNLGVFESPSNQGDGFGARYRGYICAPESGNYTFFFASDNGGELYVSTDANPANKRLIASLPYCSWALPREWTKYPEQKSALINLVAGQKYYVEALYREGAGGDNLAVAWQKPSTPTVLDMVPGSILSPFSTVAPARLATSLSFNADAHQVGQTIELTWASNANKQADYYIIEKLDPKLALFKPVAYVNAQYAQEDLALHNYAQLDKQPEIGDNTYRIGVILDNRPPQYTDPLTVNFKSFELGELYPNPAIDVVHIDLSADVNQPTTIHIVDIVGQVQLTKSFDKAPTRTSLDIGHLPNGQYIVRIESKGKRAMVKKLMVFRE